MRTFSEHNRQESTPDTLPVTGPVEPEQASSTLFRLVGLPEAVEGVYGAIDEMSRRIEDLARELNCLGYFDGDDDRPRAA
jgi:hypothetical protein